MVVLFISGWVSSRRRGQRSPSGPGGPGRIIGIIIFG